MDFVTVVGFAVFPWNFCVGFVLFCVWSVGFQIYVGYFGPTCGFCDNFSVYVCDIYFCYNDFIF